MALAMILWASKRENEVAKPDLGKKRTCLGCGAKFYDLNHDTVTCPKCEAVLDLAALARVRRPKAAPKVDTPKPKLVESEAVDGEERVDDSDDDEEDGFADTVIAPDDDEKDDDLIEDASELGEDKDDLFEVIDTVEEKAQGEEI
jgi:uncharacterized protein (TIGR02300 family)